MASWELKTGVKAAEAAGKVMMKYFGRTGKVEEKASGELVSRADLEAEKEIARVLLKEFPSHGILGEEKFKDSGKEFLWVVDPIDGTHNFIHGLPQFCTSIALVKNSEPILGIVFDPYKKHLFTAEKGKGAFFNGKKIKVSGKKELSKSFLVFGLAYDRREGLRKSLKVMNEIAVKAWGLRRPGAAALDLAYVAAGIFDGFWEFHLKPWDIAAGELLVREACGEVTDFKGEKWHLESSGNVLATNGKIHGEMLELIQSNAGGDE